MTANRTNPKVDFFFEKPGRWREEYARLRTIALASPLTEELKWGCPCYTFETKNVVLIHGFKDYCAVLFTKGALLKDPEKILIQQTANVQSARQARFTSVADIVAVEAALKAYILEAIDLEKAGKKVDFKPAAAFPIPAEFQARLDADPALKAAFHALTPGRQRGYLLHFAGAKQSATRAARVDKCAPMIFDGVGLDR